MVSSDSSWAACSGVRPSSRRRSFATCSVNAWSNSSPARPGERDDPAAAVARAALAGDQAGAFEPVDALGHGARGDHGVRGQLAGRAFVGRSGAPEGGEYVEVSLAQPVLAVHHAQPLGQVTGEAVQPSDHAQRAHVQVGPLAGPRLLDAGDVVEVVRHDANIPSVEAILLPWKVLFGGRL